MKLQYKIVPHDNLYSCLQQLKEVKIITIKFYLNGYFILFLS